MNRRLVPLAVALGWTLALAVPAAAQDVPTETRVSVQDAVTADHYGTAVAAGLDVVVAGAPAEGGDAGAAYVYNRLARRWLFKQRLEAGDPTAGARFGAAVGVDGGIVAVGAPGEDGGMGAVYIYVFDPLRSAFIREQRVTASVRADTSAFGSAVSVSGDSILVGAPGDAAGAGAAYSFVPSLPNQWVEQDRVVPSSFASGDAFGASLSLRGILLGVGAPGAEGGRGSAFVFEKSGRRWVEQGAFVPSTESGVAGFGRSVTVGGVTAIVGADASNEVYVFGRDENVWEQTQVITPPSGDVAPAFGRSVALHIDRLAVGDPEQALGAGAVYVYSRAGGVFTLRGTLMAAAAAPGEALGSQVAVYDDDIPSGAPRSDAPGSASLFDLRGLVRAFLLPKKVRVRGPSAKRAAGLTVSGVLDRGPSPVDLTKPGTLRIGDLAVALPGLDAGSGGRFGYEDGTTAFEFRPAKSGTSAGRFSLRYTGDLGGAGIASDGALRIEFENADFVATAVVQLTNGKFKLGKVPGSLLQPVLAVENVTGKHRGRIVDKFAFRTRFATDGSVPEIGPTVIVRFGDRFEQLVKGTLFQRKRNRWQFKGERKASGLVRLVIDYAKGTVTAKAQRLDIDEFIPGEIEMSVGLTVDGVSRQVETRAFRKGKTLRY